MSKFEELCKKNRYSQPQLAREVGVSTPTVAKWWKGFGGKVGSNHSRAFGNFWNRGLRKWKSAQRRRGERKY